MQDAAARLDELGTALLEQSQSVARKLRSQLRWLPARSVAAPRGLYLAAPRYLVDRTDRSFTPKRLHELSLHIRPGQADITQHVVIQSHQRVTTGGALLPHRPDTQNAARSVEQRGPNVLGRDCSNGSPCIQASIQHRKFLHEQRSMLGSIAARGMVMHGRVHAYGLGSPPASARFLRWSRFAATGARDN